MRRMFLHAKTGGSFIVALLLGVFFGFVQGKAQNVIVSENTGSMICSQTVYGGGNTELGFAGGGFATWKHYQLPLTMTSADYSNLSSNGQLAVHANNLYNVGKNKGIIITGGKQHDGLLTLALPRGYRFTGYKIIVQNNVLKFGGKNNLVVNHKYNMYFGETNSAFTFKTGYFKNLGKGVHNTEYVVERTIGQFDDVVNILYFKLSNGTNGHQGNAFVGATMKHVELYFTPEAPFYVSLAPQTTSETGVSVARCPFATGKVDVGLIKQNKYTNVTRQSYIYTNVKDQMASCLFYEKASVDETLALDARTAGSAAGNNTIKAVRVGQKNYFQIEPGQTYFAETPVSAYDQMQNTVPLYYRITAAKINYQPNGEQGGDYFYITYVYDGTTYYLQDNGQFDLKKQGWRINGDGHIYSVDTHAYLSVTENNELTVSGVAPGAFEIENGSIKIRYTSLWMIGNPPNEPVSFDEYNADVVAKVRDASAGYTLKVYEANGERARTIDVTEEGTVEIDGLNNDAIKLEVEGGSGLVNIELQIESLDPYINRMELICNHGEAKVLREFVSNDFTVGGGKFYFTIPREWLNTSCNFTFENLKSNYADNTYFDGSTNGNSRYSYVKSDYYNLFGLTNNNIYSQPQEAANHDYKAKVYVAIAGKTAFKFNNADEVSKLNTATSLQEYPFTLEAYAAGGGEFSNVVITPLEENKDYQTNAYVFTTDETRYNIAPTTATQHRYYAYYNMEIHLEARTYTPSVTFKKVYDNSFYGDEETGSFYGVEISSTDDKGNLGYSSIEEVKGKLEAAIKAGGADVPNAMSKLLYVDMGSKMEGTYASNNDSWNALKNALAKNAMIFLPKNTTHDDDNFAYAEEGGSFRASRNIILTDKQPFYSPYKIRVDAANYARYIREVTGTNKQVRKSTLMLPFALKLVEGNKFICKGATDACSFDVYVMQPENCLTVSAEQKPGYDFTKFDGDVHFIPAEGESTEANKPYLIEVDEGYTPADGQSFVVFQYGAEIMPSVEHLNKSFIVGDIAEGHAKETTYRFEHRGTYCGSKFTQVFYFANNKYFSSLNLPKEPKEVKVRPFRSCYSFTSTSGAKMLSFDIVFGANNPTTGINDVKANADLAVTAGNGAITFYAKKPQRVEVFSVNGVCIAKMNLKANETKSVPVAAGVYVVNGVKVSVQ